jgi:hypothetical protein
MDFGLSKTTTDPLTSLLGVLIAENHTKNINLQTIPAAGDSSQ